MTISSKTHGFVSKLWMDRARMLIRFRNILTRENQAITPQSAPKFDEEFDFGHKNSLSL